MIKPCKDCPAFPITENSEWLISGGCLPSLHEMLLILDNENKIWACHSKEDQPCAGLVLECIERKKTLDFSYPLMTLKDY